ncbi:MAG TPA: cytochrome c oxidase subunit 3 [Acetobacteraceae bacterium]|nr:cytochrome c oxidase subunit 3 [Acetobacteraceae bacterium]
MSEHAHGAPHFEASGLKQPYHLVDPSPWPIIGAVGGFLIVLGIILAAHYGDYYVLTAGAVVVFIVMYFWWRDVVHESRTPGVHTPIVRIGLRYGMLFFITSEVMFFVAFFWSYFNFALFPSNVSGLANPVWPPPNIHTPDPFHLAILMTMILLLSGTTITWAHHSLIENDRKGLLTGLGITILLGASFTAIQLWEYTHSPFVFVGGGVYPSVFFLATGFHGFHVIVGTCFLIVCWFRAKAGQFTPQRHFGFEAAAWYWHFVDVVWLFLFTCVYWWGASAIVAAP